MFWNPRLLGTISQYRWQGGTFHGKPRVINHGTMQIGSDVFVRSSPVQTHIVVERSGRLILGDRVSIGHGSGISSQIGIEIGDDVLIGPFVLIMDTDHHNPENRNAEPARAPIYIGAGSRIGAHATLLRGAHIGEKVWVGAGSVVIGRIPPGAVVRGIPAR